ncbi:DUF3060 domain-containing protein [Hyalangium gracile]|uniref:DUF3060 domain-containing protein n=1 Tax=Hyalangium gracile TaxID=394092 RepID=UPI001CCE9D7D|nr:DUF3060 domain-containing protein [Hyalangium gracile]
MSKAIRSAVIGLTVCLAMTASAQSSVQVGKDGSVKVQSGGNKVDVKGGSVNVQADDDDDDDTDSATTSTSESEIDIADSGRKGTLSCTGNTEVSISGSSNDFTITGDCKSVEVTGSSNKVAVDGVGKIEVTGTSNSVTWKRAVGGAKKPKVDNTGTANKVSQAK